jgi:hypothetical protein
VLGRPAFGIGAASHISLSFPFPDVLPGGATGQRMVDALVTTLFDVAMQWTHPLAGGVVPTGAAAGAGSIGTPETHVIEPLAAKMGALTVVTVVVVVTAMM